MPPSRQACSYAGKISDDDYLRHFSGDAAGKVLLSVMPTYPWRWESALCGHRPGASIAQILDNLSRPNSAGFELVSVEVDGAAILLREMGVTNAVATRQ